MIALMKLHADTLYGWGWSDSSGGNADVAPPFDVEATLTICNEFRVPVGRINEAIHPFFGKWVALSPFPVVKEWGYCHLCVFDEEPPIATELRTLMESARLTGFANVNPISD
jgi:hypothetical protein